jgi:hypothetical protein
MATASLAFARSSCWSWQSRIETSRTPKTEGAARSSLSRMFASANGLLGCVLNQT